MQSCEQRPAAQTPFSQMSPDSHRAPFGAAPACRQKPPVIDETHTEFAGHGSSGEHAREHVPSLHIPLSHSLDRRHAESAIVSPRVAHRRCRPEFLHTASRGQSIVEAQRLSQIFRDSFWIHTRSSGQVPVGHAAVQTPPRQIPEAQSSLRRHGAAISEGPTGVQTDCVCN